MKKKEGSRTEKLYRKGDPKKSASPLINESYSKQIKEVFPYKGIIIDADVVPTHFTRSHKNKYFLKKHVGG